MVNPGTRHDRDPSRDAPRRGACPTPCTSGRGGTPLTPAHIECTDRQPTRTSCGPPLFPHTPNTPPSLFPRSGDRFPCTHPVARCLCACSSRPRPSAAYPPAPLAAVYAKTTVRTRRALENGRGPALANQPPSEPERMPRVRQFCDRFSRHENEGLPPWLTTNTPPGVFQFFLIPGDEKDPQSEGKYP
jgi:hypothetical protein